MGVSVTWGHLDCHGPTVPDWEVEPLGTTIDTLLTFTQIPVRCSLLFFPYRGVVRAVGASKCAAYHKSYHHYHESHGLDLEAWVPKSSPRYFP